jgi:hypothetical protein
VVTRQSEAARGFPCKTRISFKAPAAARCLAVLPRKPVSEPREKRVVTVRAIRGRDPGEGREDWASATPEERMAAVWELTRLCLLWNSKGQDAPRLQRSVVRAQRTSR